MASDANGRVVYLQRDTRRDVIRSGSVVNQDEVVSQERNADCLEGSSTNSCVADLVNGKGCLEKLDGVYNALAEICSYSGRRAVDSVSGCRDDAVSFVRASARYLQRQTESDIDRDSSGWQQC